MAVYGVLIAAACVVGSRYGLTIGRPIVQSSTWHFTYAETIQFPYPVTVTLLQLAVTYGFLLCLGWVNSIYEYGLTVVVSPRARVRSDPSGPSDSSSVSAFSSRFGLKRTEALETLALATSIAVADVLTAFTLFTAPFQIFLFACSFTIPVSLLLARYLATQHAIPSAALLPAALLCLGIIMAAYRPNLPHSPHAIWAAVISSLLAAVWPFQLERALRSPSKPHETQYQRIGSGSSTRTNSPDSSDTPSSLHVLQHTILLTVIAVVPILLFSGELGHIGRNCYFLKVPNFWIFLFGGATFRAILLISSALFIKWTSALNFIILIALVEVSQVGPLTYSKLLSSQLLALALCLLTGVWFYCCNDSSRNSTAALEDAADLEDSKPGRNPFQKKFPKSFLRVVAHIILLAGCIQIFREVRLQPVPDEGSPISRSSDGTVIEMLHGTDAYLGQRPHFNAVANFSILVEECRGTYEHLDNIYNVRRCLDFLSTRQDEYISTSVQIVSHKDTPIHNYIEPNGSNLDSSGIITVTYNSDGILGKCDGPIIPYHIWWTGLPTWRIELFIKSYFYTQNLACSKLWIWINTDHHPGAMNAWLQYPRFQRFMPSITRGDIILKEWKLPPRVPLPFHLDELDSKRYYTHLGSPNTKGECLVADSIIRDSTGQEWIQIYQDGEEPQLTYYIVAVSDAARLIILHLHGGVYMDPDMLLLRDLRPLLLANHGFAERWGTSSDHEAYNNGFLYLPANSTISSYLLLGGTRMGMVYHFLALGRMLVQEGRDDKNISDPRSLLKLENAFFDPIWVENDGHRIGRCSVPCLTRFEQLFEGPIVQGEWDSFDGKPLEGPARASDVIAGIGAEAVVVNRTLENFYRGAYAVHVHNLWGLKYELGSWIDVMTRAHDGFFAGERTNAYGERWEGPKIEGYLEV